MVQRSITFKWLVLQTIINSYYSTAAIDLTCGQTIKKFHETIDFKSPQFPKYLNADSTCEISVKLERKYKFVRIDFVNITMDGQGLFGDVDSPGLCESDMFFFKGFKSWTPPPKCGNLNGYSYLFDERSTSLRKRTFKIVALMSSKKYRWHIRIKQVIKGRKIKSGKNNPSKRHVERGNRLWSNMSSEFTTPPVKFIQKGIAVSNETVPWLVSIRTKTKGNLVIQNCPDVDTEGVHFCGGTIIGPDIILSAAHCFYGISKYSSFPKLESLKVVVGETNVCKDNSRDPIFPTFDYDVQSIVFYYGHDPSLKFHDIVVIKLKSNITFMDHIRQIKIEKSTINKIRRRQMSGFGAWDQPDKGYSIKSNTLQSRTQYFPYNPQVSFFRLFFSWFCSFNKLNDFMRHEFFAGDLIRYDKYRNAYYDTLCVAKLNIILKPGDEGKPAYKDSGGPVVTIREGKEPLLAGIVMKVKKTFLDEEAKHFLMVHVAKKRPWIESVVESFNGF